MSVPGHHALLFEVGGGVVVVGAALFFLLTKKKKQIVEEMTAEDMQRIDDRLVTGDFARSQSRFRRRYGVEAKPKDFAVQKPPAPETSKEEPKADSDKS